jgi:hypothetical protein
MLLVDNERQKINILAIQFQINTSVTNADQHIKGDRSSQSSPTTFSSANRSTVPPTPHEAPLQ